MSTTEIGVSVEEKNLKMGFSVYIEPEIVAQVEKVLLTHDLSERLRVLKELQRTVKD